MKKVILLIIILMSFGCATVDMSWNKALFSELRLSEKVTSDFNEWWRSDEGKSLCSMTISAKKELIKKLRIKRLGANVVAEEDAERERKAKEAKLIALAEQEKATIDKSIDKKRAAFDNTGGINNTGRIKWATNHRQNSW